MGRGDRKTHKGKLFRGSFGNRRLHNKKRKNNNDSQSPPVQSPQPARQRA
jgi:ribosomal small subunit protein bTHX